MYVTFSGLALEAMLSKLVDGISSAGMTLKINGRVYGKAFVIHHSFFIYLSPTF